VEMPLFQLALTGGRWIPEFFKFQKHEDEPAFVLINHLSKYFTTLFFCPGKQAGFFY